MKRPDPRLAQIRERFSGRAWVDFIAAGRAGGPAVTLKRSTGGEYIALCPFHKDQRPSLTFATDKGFYHCFACGAHGDLIDWCIQHAGHTFAETLELLAGPLPAARRSPPAAPAGAAPRDDSGRIAWARSRWKAGRPIVAGDLLDRYLAGRAIAARPPSLRLAPAERHPEGFTGPAMVALFQALEGQAVACHRTFLAEPGVKRPGRAKIMNGPYFGAAIRLSPLTDHLVIAEGIETALTALDRLPEATVWASGSLDNLAGRAAGPMRRHPTRPGARVPSEIPDMDRPGVRVPPAIARITLIADSDGDPEVGRARLRCAANRFTRAGHQVAIVRPRPGRDLNDEAQDTLATPPAALAANNAGRLNAPMVTA
jgi:hypothetical protein